MSAPSRPTRKEQQARTRAALIGSAMSAMASKGLQAASIAEIAADAGFTKGAFYANFASKDELLLAVLDETFDRAVGDIERAVRDHDDIDAQARDAGDAWITQTGAEPRGGRLFLELMVHAVRDEAFRAAFVERRRGLRDRVTRIYEERAAELGLVAPFPLEDAARMTSVMAHGVALDRLVEPDGIGDDFFGTMLVTFFAGLQVGGSAAG
ncbi:TetR/AcrR family transcriptional regulator [Patulibacter sp.]|uniref:TetR/AcrR family transcriptional regulator n=1 Tax=Patulibacter sp. TaxID=1912859 RepID=UPI00271F4CF0|nr:TetR/AcrR family transcriptional regulator [Patulibacter sp.]MDO9408330.1 TetR/AcrR family transcriptional regulator [Patulibacter sp.]